MTRRSTIHFLALASLVATTSYALERSNSYGSDTNAAATPVAEQRGDRSNLFDGADGRGFRLREGMKLVEQIGELKEAGGRIVFYPDGETHSLQLLENLALERISEELDHSHRKWSVTGIVTEYRGGNYLLLHRAVLKAPSSNSRGLRP